MNAAIPLNCSEAEDIVARALEGRKPSFEEISAILTLSSSSRELAEIIFAGAREARRLVFADRVFLYGFVYLSTYCRNDCFFCHYRSSRGDLERYRKSTSEIVDVAGHLAENGVQVIDLTLGEDLAYTKGAGFEKLLKAVDSVAKFFALPVMLSPGVLERTQIKEARSAGASWFALYQETHTPELFAAWRRGQDFEERRRVREMALDEGFLVEDGVLTGAGATPSDLARSVQEMTFPKAQQVRAMAYVPAEGGLPPDASVDAAWQELLMIACLRLSSPNALIPASLDVEGIGGLKARLSAGANVVTSIVPARRGLAGVATMTLDIENSNRSPSRVREILEEERLRSGASSEYAEYLDKARIGFAEIPASPLF
ncbi:MAG: methylornithine synthase PylB [Deltaproteobacteria bacterium]|jgi:methylornithine synthase|nr:methylornithine synthase PylB [Deltaproteobacteria bacterium]